MSPNSTVSAPAPIETSRQRLIRPRHNPPAATGPPAATAATGPDAAAASHSNWPLGSFNIRTTVLTGCDKHQNPTKPPHMIVADASWVVALRDPGDDHHARAIAINRLIGNEDVLLHPVTLAECLVAPAQIGALDTAAATLRASFEIPEVDHDAPLRWAALRAETAPRLPDAIVLDTALSFNARALATATPGLRLQPEITRSRCWMPK